MMKNKANEHGVLNIFSRCLTAIGLSISVRHFLGWLECKQLIPDNITVMNTSSARLYSRSSDELEQSLALLVFTTAAMRNQQECVCDSSTARKLQQVCNTVRLHDWPRGD